MSAQYFAQVTDGVVTRVAVVQRDFLEANPERYQGEWIETFFDTEGKTYAGIGWTWNGTDFVAPVAPTPIEEI
jgi:hypothetical protein